MQKVCEHVNAYKTTVSQFITAAGIVGVRFFYFKAQDQVLCVKETGGTLTVSHFFKLI